MNMATIRGTRPVGSRRAWLASAIAVGLIGAGWSASSWLTRQPGRGAFQEFKLPHRTDMPVAIAAAPDGTVWFTLEASDAIGRLRNGQLERIPKGAESIEPLGLAVGSDGSVWYTEAAQQRISRVAPDGAIASFKLSTPVAQLGRLAIGPDGTVWFAETTVLSVTRLRDGRLTRHVVGTLGAGVARDAEPYGVAIAPDGAVWATLPSADKVLRIGPDGHATAFDVPTRQGGLGDIAVDANGTVYFVEMAANKVGRIVGARVEEFAVPTPRAGVMALAVGPDGAAWFTELRGHRLGRLHGNRVMEFELPRADARPFGITVDSANNVWYSDISGWLGRLDAAHARVR